MHFGTGSIKIANNCRHTSFIAHSGCEMRFLLGVIFWKALYSASMAGGALAREKGQRAMARRFELPAISKQVLGYNRAREAYRCDIAAAEEGGWGKQSSELEFDQALWESKCAAFSEPGTIRFAKSAKSAKSAPRTDHGIHIGAIWKSE